MNKTELVDCIYKHVGRTDDLENLTELAEEISRMAADGEREAWMKAVADEPELPGEMPDEMWEAIRNDRDTATEALRITVRQTKGGILTRGMRSNAKVQAAGGDLSARSHGTMG